MDFYLSLQGIKFYYIFYYLLFSQGSAPVGGIHNCENKSITAISLAQLLFHQHNCKFLRRNSTDKWQNCKCNVTTANEMSQLQFEWHNCKNKIAENVPCFLKSRNTSNFIFRSNYYICPIYRSASFSVALLHKHLFVFVRVIQFVFVRSQNCNCCVLT